MDKFQIILTKIANTLEIYQKELNTEKRNLTNNQHLLNKEENNIRRLDINIRHLNKLIEIINGYKTKRHNIIKDIIADYKSPTYIIINIIIFISFYCGFNYLNFSLSIAVILSLLSSISTSFIIGICKYLYYTNTDRKIIRNQNIKELNKNLQTNLKEKNKAKNNKYLLKQSIQTSKSNINILENKITELNTYYFKINSIRDQRIQELIMQNEPDLQNTYELIIQDIPQIKKLLKES